MTASLRQPTGTTSPARRKLAAGSLIAGSLVMVATTLAGVAPPQNLLILGAVLLVAWLIDGSTRRYVGAGLIAVAVGGGLTLGTALGIEPVRLEHTVIYPLIGLAILLALFVDTHNVRAGALTLLFIGASAANQGFGVSFNLGWEFVAVLALWGVIALALASRDRTGPSSGRAQVPAPPQPASTASPASPTSRGRPRVDAAAGSR